MARSIIDYVISGLGGSKIEKVGLYEASTFAELREKQQIYEKIRKPSESVATGTAIAQSGPSSGANNIGNTRFRSQWPKTSDVENRGCFTCGQMGHLARNCRAPQKKVFKCGLERHLALRCYNHQTGALKRENI